MAITYESIASTTLSTSAANIEFTSISSAYTDLRLVISVLTVNSIVGGYLRFNGSTSSYYIARVGSSGTTQNDSFNNVAQLQIGQNLDTGIPSSFIIDIFNYAGSTNKNCIAYQANDQSTSGRMYVSAGRWENTSAITSVRFLASSGNLAAGTTASLYGILKA